jgi:ribosomal protein S18 acetylase RimI-like enzyme
LIIKHLQTDDIAAVEQLISQSGPFVRPRTASDYWVYAELFSSTCPVAIDHGELVGAIIAFRSQEKPGEIYIQDVAVHPAHRRRGVTHALMDALHQRATAWGGERIYLTSEPENTAARATWPALGFVNVPGDQTIDGVSVISDYKGPGKHRAVYELIIK